MSSRLHPRPAKKSGRAHTDYIVLKLVGVDWRYFGKTAASSADTAIRQAVGAAEPDKRAGTFVAVPARNMERRISVERRLVEELKLSAEPEHPAPTPLTPEPLGAPVETTA